MGNDHWTPTTISNNNEIVMGLAVMGKGTIQADIWFTKLIVQNIWPTKTTSSPVRFNSFQTLQIEFYSLQSSPFLSIASFC